MLGECFIFFPEISVLIVRILLGHSCCSREAESLSCNVDLLRQLDVGVLPNYSYLWLSRPNNSEVKYLQTR